MEYGLTQDVLECEHFLRIPEAVFGRIASARDRSIRALEIEENLDMLLHNYVDFEHELLQISLRNALFSVGDWSEFRSVIQDLNRRMVNLLSTARLYLDHLRHRSAPLLKCASADSGAVEAIISHEYEARRGYRVMEALRNHVQHRGLPLHSITRDPA